MHCIKLVVLTISAVAFAGLQSATAGELSSDQTESNVVAFVQGKGGLHPVSDKGILLASEGYKGKDVQKYLQIEVGGREPIGPVGTKYGFKAVTDAAKIAVVLNDAWRGARVNAIAVVGSGVRHPHEYVLEPARHGIRIYWGHAPGFEVEGEALAETKLERLLKFVSDNSPEYSFLASPSMVLDLRPKKGAFIRSDLKVALAN